MTDKLLICYDPDNSEQAHWAFVNEQGQCHQLGHGPVSALSDIARGHRAILLIDTANLNISQVAIPTQNRQRQLQAIPFALEDTLADDIEELHFAAGKKQHDDLIPVISIKRSLLDSIINQFKDNSIFIETLSADVLALPSNNDQWSLLIDGSRALIKTSDFSGYYCDLDNLGMFLTALIAKQKNQPALLKIFCNEQQIPDLEQLKENGVEIQTETYKETPLHIFSANLKSPAQLNILQGNYTPKRESSGLLQPWKSVAAIFAIWMCLHLVYAGFEIRQLKSKNIELTGLIQKEFKKANPGTKNYSNMKKRMERRLTELRGGGDNNDQQLFLKLLSEATPALASNNKITINGIVFRNKFVDLDLQADSLQTLESVKSKLTATAGLKIVMSTSVEKDKVKGRLRLETQG